MKKHKWEFIEYLSLAPISMASIMERPLKNIKSPKTVPETDRLLQILKKHESNCFNEFNLNDRRIIGMSSTKQWRFDRHPASLGTWLGESWAECLTWFPVEGTLTVVIMNKAGWRLWGWMSPLPHQKHRPIWHCVIIMSVRSHELWVAYQTENGSYYKSLWQEEKKIAKQILLLLMEVKFDI